MKEEKLYPIVENFALQHFDCFASKIRTGLRGFGKVDVSCARRIVRDLSQTNELISIEVKPSTQNYCKIIGQALGYSVFSHRCYLAVLFKRNESFSRDQRIIANKLGVGLVEIHKGAERSSCKEVLTSSYFLPQEDMLHMFLQRMDLVECVICRRWFDPTRYTQKLDKAITRKLPFVYWLWDLDKAVRDERAYVYHRRHVCRDCIQLLGRPTRSDSS